MLKLTQELFKKDVLGWIFARIRQAQQRKLQHSARLSTPCGTYFGVPQQSGTLATLASMSLLVFIARLRKRSQTDGDTNRDIPQGVPADEQARI